MTKKFYNTNDKKFGVRAFEEGGKYADNCLRECSFCCNKTFKQISYRNRHQKL